MEEKNPLGIFLNTDALSDRVLERLSKDVKTVLKVADENTMITGITVPNDPDGMEINFHAETQDLAFEKPELAETPSQKRIKQLKVEDRMKQWEVRLAVSDEALKNKNMSAAGFLSTISAGKAFARAMNAEGLSNMYAGVAGVAAVAPWNAATNSQIEMDIAGRLDTIDDENFTGDTILMDRLQIARLNHTLNVVMFGGKGISVKNWLMDNHELGLLRTKRVNYKNNNGTLINLFNPAGQVMIFDKAAYSVFTQEPMTTEVSRVPSIGGYVAYMRKKFKTTPVQPEAAQKIVGTVL